MNEQQRLFVTLSACMGVWLGWQAITGQLYPPAVEQPPEATQSAPAQQPPALQAQGSAAVGATSAPAAPAAVAPLLEVHRAFDTPLFAGVMRNGDAGLTGLSLLHYNERSAGEQQSEPVSLVDAKGDAQAIIAWELPDSQPISLDFDAPQGLSLHGHNAEGLYATVAVTPRAGAYALDYHLTVTNRGKRPYQVGASLVLAMTPLVEPTRSFSPLSPPSDPLSALCDNAGSLSRLQASDLRGRPFGQDHTARWAALDRQYFVTAVVPRQDDLSQMRGHCTMGADGEALNVRFGPETALLEPGQSWETDLALYGGPKRDQQLTEVHPALRQVINYNLWKLPLGFLARPMMYALGQFYALSGSWGVSIVLLTLFVKTLLFPVTYRSAMSMRRVQQLRPEIQALQTKYANDRERQQTEMMKLYRERNINPVSGCLPMLMQAPVWLTLYRTLWTAVDLYQQPFLWLPDLTAQEPIPVMGLLVGAVTVVQQRLTPLPADNPQARTMMWIMPIILTALTIALPSGLVLYILVNSVLTVLQQLAINRRAPATS